jgi:hypothetical protein
MSLRRTGWVRRRNSSAEIRLKPSPFPKLKASQPLYLRRFEISCGANWRKPDLVSKNSELIIRPLQARLYSLADTAASIDRAGVRPLRTAQPTEIMNAIDSHKDGLERLLVNLSRDAAVSGSAFVALLDAYIRDLDRNCTDSAHALIQRRRKLTGNQRGTNINSELRALLRATYNSRRSRPIFSKFSGRSSQTCLVYSTVYVTPHRQVRRCH